MRIAVFVVAASALALAGCNQTPPPRRPGLWIQFFSRDGTARNLGALRSVQVCIDAKSEAKSAIFNYDRAVELAKKGHCNPPTAGRGLDGVYTFTSDCPMPSGNGRSALKGTASGDFTTAFHLHMQTVTTYSPPFTPLNNTHSTDIDGKWLGPCPPGMAPADMRLANGVLAHGGRLPDPHRGPMHPLPQVIPPGGQVVPPKPVS